MIREAGIVLDVVAYTQVLRAMAVSKRIADAEYVIQVMENEGVEPNVITYTTLIRGYTKMSDVEGAESVVDRMVEHGVARNDFTYNTLQQGYLRMGDFDAAHGVLARMEEDGVTPDSVTFVQLIAGCAKKGRVGEAESVFASIPMAPTLTSIPRVGSCVCKRVWILWDGWGSGSLYRKPWVSLSGVGGACQYASLAVMTTASSCSRACAVSNGVSAST